MSVRTAFREDAPRPPVPGGEEESASTPAEPHPPPPPSRRPPCGEAGGGVGGDADAAATEGDGAPAPPCLRSPPPQLRWARHLHALLEDPEGVALFRRFLEQEGPAHADTLDFWFACEGLKKQRDPERTAQLVKVIHRRFFVKTQLAIPEELRKEVNRRVKEGGPGGHVFDSVQAQVERLITETTYPNFLRGELYLQHVQALQGGGGGGGGGAGGGETCSPPGSSSGAGSGGGVGGVGCTGMLPTLPEDAELSTDALPLPLTRDTLLATQRRRHELRPRPEAFAGMYLQHGPVPPPHPAYSSYNPVSRQDSELQSLSSDARTESDNMSLTDSSVDGASQGRGRRRQQQLQQRLQQQQGREARGLDHRRSGGGGGGERGGGERGEREANLQVNRDAHLHHVVIPRTQRLQRDQLQPLPPPAFAQLLCSKLEAVLREREVHDVLQAKLHDGELVGCEERGPECPGARSLPDAIREKLQIEDDSDQAILDQHVSRVWSDLTPARSPGLISPRPRSPEGRRQPSCTKMGPCPAMGVHPSHALRTSHCPRHAHARKEKDVFSTFSSDSGNVHDFPEGPDLRHHMPKSKSMPLDHQEAQKQEPFAPLQGYDPRFRQSRDGCRRSSSKKTLTDLTDSGVSVVSDSAPVAPLSQSKDSRVLSWLLESEKSEREGTRHARARCQPLATSPGASRHGLRRSAANGGGSSRSGSLERGTTCVGAAAREAAAGGNGGAWGGVGAPGPAQPFVADPSMPPLPMPHTDSQLEEARRRLLEASTPRAASRHGGSRPCTHLPLEPLSLPCSSGPPTLRKGGSRQRAPCTGPSCHSQGPFQGQGEPPDCTTVVFSFCDEQFPYRTKIPGRSITLRQFKEYLPKKGSYRFFFKTECEDLDMKVIHEEVTEDNDVLPLWEGKVMAQVKPVD